MSLLNDPEYNTPEIIGGLLKAGMDPWNHSQLADAFRIGWVAAQHAVRENPDWSEWRPWNGEFEEGPVSPSDFVEVIRLIPDGSHKGRADSFNWAHTNHVDNIKAYRVLPLGRGKNQ